MTIKHSKYRNTGIIFELLSRQIASDTMHGRTPYAMTIIRTHFNKDSEIAKELALYEYLRKEKFETRDECKDFINEIVSTSDKINWYKANRERTQLVKSIKKYYDLKEFFSAKVNDYPTYANIYKVLQYKTAKRQPEVIRSKARLIETMIRKEEVIEEQNDFNKLTPEMKRLTFKIMIDRFNEKYNSTLNESQKELLRAYINEVSNSNTLKTIVDSEIKSLVPKLQQIQTADRVLKIKLKEVASAIEHINEAKSVNETHILNLLRVYELIDKINNSQWV